MPNAATTSSDLNSRIDWVDAAKGICIFLVVMMHTTLGLEAASGQRGWMHTLVEFSKPFRMPDFFLISGLFLAATINRPWRLYLDRKVLHFAYFYVLWVLIQFAFKGPFMVLEGNSIGAVLRTLAFSLVQPFGILWFIYMLPVFFVVTKLLKRFGWGLLAAAALLQIAPINTGALMASVAPALGVVSVDSHFVLIDEFASFYVYFLAGYLCAPQIFRLAEWARKNSVLAMVGLAAWLVFNGAMVQTGWAFLPVLSLMMGGLGAFAIVATASLLTRYKAVQFLARPLTHLGAHSIVVYLAFFLPMIITRLIMLRFAPNMDAGTMALICIVISIVTPLIGYAVIQRIGFGRFLFHRPAWAIMAEKPTQESRAQLHPAE